MNEQIVDTPVAVIEEAVQEDVLGDLADAIIVGSGKHPLKLSHSRPREYYIGAMRRHLGHYLKGELFDNDDGHKHLAAVFVRLCQLMAKDNEEVDLQPGGYGVA